MTSRAGLVGLVAAEGISALGTRMSFLAVPWFVLTITGSPTQTGLVAAAEMTPYVLVQGFGGPLVDRCGAWRVSVWTDIGAALSVAAVPVLAARHTLSLPLLAALVAAAGGMRGAGDSARMVLLPGVGERAGTAMERTAGLFDGVSRAASLIGAPLAGVLIAVTSPTTVLIVDAVTFALSAAVVSRWVPRAAQPRRPAPSEDEQLPYLTSLLSGFHFLATDRLLLGIGAMIMVTNLLDQANGAVLRPVWAKEVAGSPVALGLLGGAFSAGAVLGNIVVTWRGPRLPRRMTYAVGFLLAGAPSYLALAVSSTVWPVLPVFFIGGVGAGGINPILGAVEFERVPRHLQARVLGALGATAWAGIPVGTLAGGAATSALGIRGALLVAAGIYLLTTLTPFGFPCWRAMDERPAPSFVRATVPT